MKTPFFLKENFSSENLWQKVNLLTQEQITTLEKGLTWTVNNIPDAVLIGGTATVNYVVNDRKLTPDFDFLVRDISAVKDLLYNEGIKYDPLTIGIGDSLGIVVQAFNCDYLDVNVGNVKMNKLILETYNKVKIGGYEAKIIKPELLAVMKFETGRDRDLEDAFALLQSGQCNKENYISYLAVLQDCLHEYDSIHSYLELF